MPEIKFEVDYPEKYLQNLATFSYLMDRASKDTYPVGKNASKSYNEFWRAIFRYLATISFWLFMLSNKILKILFKLDYFEEHRS